MTIIIGITVVYLSLSRWVFFFADYLWQLTQYREFFGGDIIKQCLDSDDSVSAGKHSDV